MFLILCGATLQSNHSNLDFASNCVKQTFIFIPKMSVQRKTTSWLFYRICSPVRLSETKLNALEGALFGHSRLK